MGTFIIMAFLEVSLLGNGLLKSYTVAWGFEIVAGSDTALINPGHQLLHRTFKNNKTCKESLAGFIYLRSNLSSSS
jgi:hypothetical protein